VVPNVAVRRGEFAEFIERGFGESGDTFSEIDLRAEGAKFTARDADAFVVTGSSSSVTERAAWMERACDGLRAIVADGAYLLGLCFGHQLIGHAFGGEVALNPRGREIGTVQVRVLEDDPLFAGLGATFPIQATHTDSVVRLPRDARVLADHDGPVDGLGRIRARACAERNGTVDGLHLLRRGLRRELDPPIDGGGIRGGRAGRDRDGAVDVFAALEFHAGGARQQQQQAGPVLHHRLSPGARKRAVYPRRGRSGGVALPGNSGSVRDTRSPSCSASDLSRPDIEVGGRSR